jgi:PAS domain S-box-containing protein
MENIEKRKSNLLVIDDEVGIRDLLARTLSQKFNVTVAADGMSGIEELKKKKFEVVLTDIKMPGMGGISVLNKIKEMDSDTEVIMMTGFASMDTAIESLRDGAFDFVNKPFDVRQLESRIQKAIESYYAKKDIILLNDGLKKAYIDLEKLKDSLEEKVFERTQELTLSEKKYRSIIDSSFDPIITINSKNEITSWNKGAEIIFGFSAMEVLGSKLNNLFLNENDSFISGIMATVAKEGFARNCVTEFKTKMKDITFVNITASRIDEDNIALIIRDITKEKRIDQMKSDFVSNVSHELRTPLTSIKGAIDLILSGAEGPISDSQKEFLNICKNNSLRLIRLISDLLDLSKIEAGKIKMNMKNNDLTKTLKETIAEFRAMAEKQRINLLFEGPDQLYLPYDEDRVKQVVVNLLGNAFKFTPENGTVRLILMEKDNEISVSIIDSGMGIAKEHFDMIFEKFEQVDTSSTRVKGGSGLGLAIAKSIVESHKGRIWVESEVGKGSSFSFSLPKSLIDLNKSGSNIDMSSLISSLELAQNSYKVKKILIIDDDEDMVHVLKSNLEKESYEVTVVQTSRDALKTAIDIKPDLITLDLLMPSVDGFMIAELLKQNPSTKDIPIVIISAIFEKDRAYKLGVSDYITKPFDTQELLKSIKNIEEQISGEKLRKKILVVDDDPDISSVLALSLNERNYSVLNAYDGLQAVASAKLEKPDIIVLDLMLPEFDGFDVLKRLKADAMTKNIPVIVITGMGSKERERALSLGAKDYLLKPFSMKILMDELKKYLK